MIQPSRGRLPVWAALCLGCASLLALASCGPSSAALPVVPVTGGAALEVREYPLVEQSQDNPTHPGFQDHVRRAVQAQRQALNFSRADAELDAQNQALAPFGFRLEASASPPFSGYTLYYEGAPLREDIARFWPVSVKNATPSQPGDFLLPFLTLSGEKLAASATGVKPWPGQETERNAPAGTGQPVDQPLAYAQAMGGMVHVYAGQALLYSAPEPTPAVDVDAAPAGSAALGTHNLHTWSDSPENNDHWALEMEGSLIIDGQDINQTLNSPQVFEFRLVDGQPLYFYIKDGLTHLRYAGKDLPYIYDQILYQNEGPLQVFNPGSAGNLVWFYALRDGLWYYVEASTVP